MNAVYAFNALVANLIAAFIAEHGDTVLVISQYDADAAYEGRSGESRTTNTVANEVKQIENERYGLKELHYILTDNNPMDRLKGELTSYYGEWGGARVETQAEYDERVEREEREELELFVSSWAENAGVAIGTTELLDAVHDALEQARDDQEQDMGMECTMEDWAAHQAAGCTSEFWSNRDYTRNQHDRKIRNLERAWAWLERKTPLTVALWREQKMQEEVA